MQGRPLVLVVAAALVRADGRLLLAQRPEGKSLAGLWELPGGKVEPGESPEEALVREIAEELGVRLDAAHLVPFDFASHAFERFHLLMPVFMAQTWSGEPEAREGQGLKWVTADEAMALPSPPADGPLFERFAAWSRTR